MQMALSSHTSFSLIDVGTVILIPADDRDRNLAIADEMPTLWM
jgi:hypothetical protein